MDYGSLIREAWTLTWRYRFLWVLGLFSGAAIGSCSGVGNAGNQFQYQLQRGELEQLVPGAERSAGEAAQWVTSHPMLIVVVVGLVLLLVVAAIVVSLIAQGGMTEATVDLAQHRPTSLGYALRSGVHLFWRFLGLTLLIIAATFTVALLVAAIVALAIGTTTVISEAARGVMIALWVLIGLVIALLTIPVAILVTIALAYAQRAIVVENVGPVAAVRSGWHLLRAHLGSSLVIWLVNVGLSLVAGLAIVAATIGVIVALAAIGIILWTALGSSAVVIAYAALGVLATIAALWLMSAIVNTFFWNYWSLAYLRLTGVQPTPAP